VWDDAPDFDVCAEHYRAIQLGEDVDELLYHLDRLGAWIAIWDEPSEAETRLQYRAFEMRDRLVEELWRATVKDKAAECIAMRGPR
jgi:hypothetical protein